jgi:hypothetical protein
MGLVLCAVSFLASFVLGLRSLVAGLGAVLTAGYLYGILRANYLDTFAHFIFDAAVVGFYLALLIRTPVAARAAYVKSLKTWVTILIGWAGVMFVLPLQHPLIQLVGLRGNAFLLPFILVGGWLQATEALRLSLWMAVLNLVALGFGAAQFFLGVERFFPLNPVTELIYRCNDVVNSTALRIPACFPHSAGYGGTMMLTIPWLIGAWARADCRLGRQLLLAAGTTAAVLGIFMCASRSAAVLLGLMLGAASLSGKLRAVHWVLLGLILAGAGYLVLTQERFQRFLTLSDTEQVANRIEGSVNMHFMELVFTYPIGNGLGAGGTSVPYFLQHLLVNPVGLENEYSRILLEQGLFGLLLWLAFLVWIICMRPRGRRDPWQVGRHTLWCYTVISFATAVLGAGMLTAVPGAVLLFLGMGFALTWRRETAGRRPRPGSWGRAWGRGSAVEPAGGLARANA